MALLAGGCSGGCEGTFDPLPKPMLASQTIEGGVQVRVTASGLRTIADAAKQIIASTIGQTGICIPQASGSGFEACYQNGCSGGTRGCRVNVSLGNLTTTTVNASTLRASVTFSASSSVPVRYNCPLGSWCNVSCSASASLSNSRIEADVRLGIAPSDGELTLSLQDIRALNINIPTASVCGLEVSGLVEFVLDLLGTDVGLLLVNLLTPTIDGFIQGLLPDPLGVAGLLNLGGLLEPVLPGIQSKVELHGVPGGYAQLPANGISVGVIVGINADRNTATRGASDGSEPSLCMPQWAAPNLGAAPALLSKTPGRQTYSLKPAGAFLGSPDPSNDVAIGLSQTLLDLAGHHIMSSGMLCLSVGSSLVPQLNLGTVGLLIRSLSELGLGNEPILIVLRPTRPITFDIGSGTGTSPHLTAHIADLEIDFYALIYERYVRAFTVAFDLDVGVNAEFMVDAQRKAFIVPTLVGLDASKIAVEISNSAILRETPEQIEGVFPTVLNLFIPLLAEGLPDIPVPTIEGFTLGDLKLRKETTSEDDFLAVHASLARASKPAPVERATTEAQVARVSTPSPERIVAYLAGQKGGALPEVELLLGGAAPTGGDLEWQWSINNGMWRPFTSDRQLVIRDLALAVQGRHTIQVRARGAGDYESTDLYGVELPVVIDSAAPRLVAEQHRRQGGEILLRAFDLVTADRELQWAAGREDEAAPATAWTAREGRFTVAELEALAGGATHVRVFVRDELGNIASELFALRALGELDQAAAAGCHVGGRSTGGAALLLLALLPLLVLRRGRRGSRAVLALVAGLGACSTTNDLVPLECKLDSECSDMCPVGQEGFCDPGSKKCVCAAAVRLGVIGAYSDIAVDPDGDAWISAYNTDWGDLMVARATSMGRVADDAWEFADGVPAAAPTNMFTEVRGGVSDPGDDVGRYTSIAIAEGGEPIVSHHDATSGSLRVSRRSAGAWTSHVVDAGAAGSDDVGKYTTISVDDSGRPGVGYLAIVKDGAASRSEVRWAQARTTSPASEADWTITVVESRAAPPDPFMGMLNDIPFVNGVFINSTRTAAGHPVLVYYDRPNGNLKLAEWDAGASRFKAPVVIDGNQPNVDVGLYPSVAASPDGKLHVAYVDAGRDNLLAITYPGGNPEVVDDGLRYDGTTEDGLPRPVFHFVGDNSQIVATASSRAVVYQDATAHELIMATENVRGGWARTKMAGSETPYKGSYGFFASCALTGEDVVMSTFALNQTTYEAWIELFKESMP